MKCNEIIENLNKEYPLSAAEEWDNVGLLVGKRDAEVSRVLVALDASDEVVDQAVEQKVQLIVTHHPLIFGSIKKINTDSFTGSRIIKLIENGISCCAMHTNFDIYGMADLNAVQLELCGSEVLSYTEEEKGFGKVGTLKEPMKYYDYAALLKKKLGISDIRCYGEGNPVVSRIAVCSGSGKSFIDEALMAGADVLVTGDVDYHTGTDAFAKGIRIIDAGHFGTEQGFIEYVTAELKQKLDGCEVIPAVQSAPYVLI